MQAYVTITTKVHDFQREEAGENRGRRGDMEWENNVIVFQQKKKK